MGIRTDVQSWRFSTLPAANEIVYPLDTTVINDRGAVTAASAPGAYRGLRAGNRVRLMIDVGDQPVTWTAQALKGVAGTSADFITDTTCTHTTGGGTGTLAASTTYQFDWEPNMPDFRFALTAGATAPSFLRTTVILDPANVG